MQVKRMTNAREPSITRRISARLKRFKVGKRATARKAVQPCECGLARFVAAMSSLMRATSILAYCEGACLPPAYLPQVVVESHFSLLLDGRPGVQTLCDWPDNALGRHRHRSSRYISHVPVEILIRWVTQQDEGAVTASSTQLPRVGGNAFRRDDFGMCWRGRKQQGRERKAHGFVIPLTAKYSALSPHRPGEVTKIAL
jgi:hypothetical protein